jgi:TatD related DNase
MYIDAHAHLDRYDETEIRQVIDEIEADQIVTLSVSMDPAAYLKNNAVAALSTRVVPSFGIHPWNAPDAHHNMQDGLLPPWRERSDSGQPRTAQKPIRRYRGAWGLVRPASLRSGDRSSVPIHSSMLCRLTPTRRNPNRSYVHVPNPAR